MTSRRLQAGQGFTFTRDLPPIRPDELPTIREGDRGVYLGDSQARILTGAMTGWLVTLEVGTPIRTLEPNEQQMLLHALIASTP